MESLLSFIRARVDPRAYYESVFPRINWPGTSEGRAMCCFHEDKSTPSLSLNPREGKWYCHGCGSGGNSIISFHAKLHGVTKQEACVDLFHKYVHPVIPDTKIVRWAAALLETPTALNYLLSSQRCLRKEIVIRHQIGWNGARFVIPIRNEFGICVNAKLYDPLAEKRGQPKMLNYQERDEVRSYGQPPMMYPLSVLAGLKQGEHVFVCEGEWDALCLIGLGLSAVTNTAGSKGWCEERYNELFRGLRVTIAYDNDKDGTRYDRSVVAAQLTQVAKEIRRLDIPKSVGKDVTDWVRKDAHMRTGNAWRALVPKARVLVVNTDAVKATRKDPAALTLDQASQAQWYHKPIRVSALVTGKDVAPYILPKKWRVTCNKACETCPLAETGQDNREVDIEASDPNILRLLDVSTSRLEREMAAQAGIHDKPSCSPECTILESFNVEQVLLIPTLDQATAQYVMRSAYYVGHGLHSNRGYVFDGVTTADPRDQHATHLFHAARPLQDEIDTFQLTPELRQQLKIFRPRRLNLMAHLMSIAEWQSRHVTKIRERPDLHIAVDLVFHSVQSFVLNGEYQQRGMLDVLIIGDTRCGKGYVTEGLIRHYGLGEMASGENCTFAGLIGGLQQAGSRWMVTWGLIPLNHNRLVAIDETSAIPLEDMAKFSRVRSEGVAEVSKIVRESTRANTRLLWLSNPRSGRPIMTYNAGVESIKELIGANEDISRFDFALTVATNEVPSDVINNAIPDDLSDGNKYPRELCRALILWAWSRQKDQVQFTPNATREVLQQAIQFGSTFSPNIPLVQAENIRVKIAKIAAAVAARVFSCDETADTLIVTEDHVKAACAFLRSTYAKPSMAYDVYSQAANTTSTIRNTTPVAGVFDRLAGTDAMSAREGLLQLHRVTVDSLGDYLGDNQMAKSVISDLVRLGCLARVEQGGNWYLKNPAFTAWLREQRARGQQPPRRKEQSNGQARHSGPNGQATGYATGSRPARLTGHPGLGR